MISLLKIPYMQRKYMVLANPTNSTPVKHTWMRWPFSLSTTCSLLNLVNTDWTWRSIRYLKGQHTGTSCWCMSR